jgi:hypothetical protein
MKTIISFARRWARFVGMPLRSMDCADRAYFERVRGTPRSRQRIRDNITALLTDDGFSNVHVIFTDIDRLSGHRIAPGAVRNAKFGDTLRTRN